MRGVCNLRAISETYIRLMEITLILAALIWGALQTDHPVLWAAFLLGLAVFLGHVAKAALDVTLWGVAQLRRNYKLNVPAWLFLGMQLLLAALIVGFILGYIDALVALARSIQA